ncbi:MAG: hypothetical protein EOO52_14655 [Gammaproteobacteria bacterium]|nr:MAG: hypothetical protein EOO52_14655 [Gammaproteobacteria bacterium]
MSKIIDEKIGRTRKFLFLMSATPIILMLFNSFVLNFILPREIMFLLMLIAFPSAVGYVVLSWKLFNQDIKKRKA